MIKIYCKFCLKLVDTFQVQDTKEILVCCKECAEVIGYTI